MFGHYEVTCNIPPSSVIGPPPRLTPKENPASAYIGHPTGHATSYLMVTAYLWTAALRFSNPMTALTPPFAFGMASEPTS